MSLKAYIPSDIESVVNTVKENGSKESPNYFRTSLVRPTALSRNLVELQQNANISYDLSVVPLALPTTHSTGNTLKSRSFDYDFLIGNTSNDPENNFLVMDTGARSWFITFKEKITSEGNIAYRFLLEDIQTSVTDIDIEKSRLELLNLSNYTENIKSVVDSTIVDGYALDYTERDYDFSVSQTTETVEEEYEGDTLLVTVKYFDITPDRLLTVVEEETLKDTQVIVGFENLAHESNFRFFNKVAYDPSLNDYYIYNSTTRYPNLRDFLESANIKPHAAFVGKIENEAGLMFNLETFYKNGDDIREALVTIPDSLGSSKLSLFSSSTSLISYKELTFKLPDDETTLVQSVSIKVLDANGEEVSSVFKDNSLTAKQWYNFFLDYGILAYPIYKTFTTETSETITEPGATPEDEPTVNVVVTEHIHTLLKGFIIKRLYTKDAVSEILQVSFTSDVEGFATTVAEGSITPFKEVLTTNPSIIKLNAVPAYTSSEKLTKVYNIGYKNETNLLSNLTSIELATTESDFECVVSNATDLVEKNYSLSEKKAITFSRDSFFNKGYGAKQALATLKTLLTTLGASVLSKDEYGYLVIDTKTTSLDNIYIKSSEPSLKTTDLQSLQTDKELLLNTDTSRQDTFSFKNVPTTSHIVVDMFYLEELSLTPFSFILEDGLLKEQDKAELFINFPDYFESSAIREQTFLDTAISSSTSLLSSYLLPVVPLYTDDEFSGCIAIFYDPVSIEGVQLANALLKIKGDSIITNEMSFNFKYISGYQNSSPVYTSLESTDPLNSVINFSEYAQIKATAAANLYSNFFDYSFNDEYNVSFEVSDHSGIIVESLTFNHTEEEFPESDYLQKSDTELPNCYRFFLKSTVDNPRYVVKVVSTSGGDLVTSKLISRDVYDNILIPLNRS